MPVYRSHIEGYVAHATSESIFVTPNSLSETAASLLDRLCATYEKAVDENPIIPEVDCVYAVKASDGQWYRGKVKESEETDEKSVNVQFIDYGNCEVVTLNELRSLNLEFMELHIMAIEVCKQFTIFLFC